MNDFDAEFPVRECAVCGDTVPVLFQFGGDATERCASCHNVHRDAVLYDPRYDY